MSSCIFLLPASMLSFWLSVQFLLNMIFILMGFLFQKLDGVYIFYGRNIVLESHNNNSLIETSGSKSTYFVDLVLLTFFLWSSYLGQYREMVFRNFYSKADEYPPLTSAISDWHFWKVKSPLNPFKAPEAYISWRNSLCLNLDLLKFFN